MAVYNACVYFKGFVKLMDGLESSRLEIFILTLGWKVHTFKNSIVFFFVFFYSESSEATLHNFVLKRSQIQLSACRHPQNP